MTLKYVYTGFGSFIISKEPLEWEGNKSSTPFCIDGIYMAVNTRIINDKDNYLIIKGDKRIPYPFIKNNCIVSNCNILDFFNSLDNNKHM